MVVLENWAVVFDPFDDVPRLKGEVYGHINFQNGHRIITSRIVSSEGRIVKTKNTVYKLGSMCPDYKKFCDKENILVDEKNPVKLT